MLSEAMERFIKEHEKEAYDLLLTIAKIPSPSNHEEKRAQFCCNWLKEQGAEGVYIDEALNVVYPAALRDNVDVYMAHTDVVFPDETELPLKVENGRICCPGVGDDTACLVCVLLAAKYTALMIKEGKLNQIRPETEPGLIFVCNSGEEGLGNLKGVKKICEDYGSRMNTFCTFDGSLEHLVDEAVGSNRYKVTVRTQGGHSFGNFGRDNAIEKLAGIIEKLYRIQVPEGGKTTYNVGTIQGGTTINSIAQEASMTYEFRSEDHKCLKYMEDFFYGTVKALGLAGWDVETEVLGIRPCNKGVDQEALRSLEESCRKVISMYWDGQVKTKASSTDANIPLSMGIPACTVGCVAGGGAHTREEWIETDSLLPGFLTALGMVMRYISS